MASVAADLAHLLQIKADINFYTALQIQYSRLYEGVSEKLSAAEKKQEKWYDAKEKAMYNDREVSACCSCGKITVAENNTNESIAESYADAVVPDYDEELMEELAELDTEYDTQKTMYETLLTELRAEQDSLKTLVGTDAKDTGLLQG